MEQTDLFLSHNWGHKGYNHKRVKIINEVLKERGYITWFDDDCMEGHVTQKMAEGIDHTKAVIVFITKQYYEKVNGGDPNDNCRKEFDYASRKKARNIIVVVMEEDMKNNREWDGLIGINIGDLLYVPMWGDLNDKTYLNEKMIALEKSIGVREKIYAKERNPDLIKATSEDLQQQPSTCTKTTSLDTEGKESCSKNRNSFVSDDALNMVASGIGEDWKNLSKLLGVAYFFIYRNVTLISAGLVTYEDAMQESFKRFNRRISWTTLKLSLQELHRTDLITLIESTNDITKSRYVPGVRNALQKVWKFLN